MWERGLSHFKHSQRLDKRNLHVSVIDSFLIITHCQKNFKNASFDFTFHWQIAMICYRVSTHNILNVSWFHYLSPSKESMCIDIFWVLASYLASTPKRISASISLTIGSVSYLPGLFIHNNGLWFCVSIRPSITTSPAAANGPKDMMRGIALHVYYIPFGQYAHPIGSGRPPWAAGE